LKIGRPIAANEQSELLFKEKMIGVKEKKEYPTCNKNE
jgi:hypothetical protein